MNRKQAKLQKDHRDKLYVVSAFSLLVFLFSLYIYFVSVSVVHVVMQQETEREVSTLQTQISTLEAEYIAAQHAVSANIASMEGYVAATNKIFINRGVTAVALSQSGE